MQIYSADDAPATNIKAFRKKWPASILLKKGLLGAALECCCNGKAQGKEQEKVYGIL